MSIRPAADRAAALRMLQAVEPWADGTAAELAEGCALLDVCISGQPVAAVALELARPVATIKAAGGHPGPAASRVALQGLAEIARRHGARWLGAWTQRPGLVRRLQRQGWRIVGHDGPYTELQRAT